MEEFQCAIEEDKGGIVRVFHDHEIHEDDLHWLFSVQIILCVQLRYKAGRYSVT